MPQIPRSGPLSLKGVKTTIKHKGKASLLELGTKLGMKKPIRMSELHGRYYSTDEGTLTSNTLGAFFVGQTDGFINEIGITSSSPWEVVEKPYWVTVSPMYSQRLNTTIQLKAGDNPYIKRRTDDLILENTQGKRLILKIDQAPKIVHSGGGSGGGGTQFQQSSLQTREINSGDV